MSLSCETARKAKILVVDDSRDAAEALSLLLELEGFAVVIAHNGLEALEHLKTDKISVAILDLWMPVMNGWEFLHQKAESEAIADIPVIVLSANPPTDRPQGTQAVLQKPVYPQGLLAAIDRCRT
jgi:CheY-like chemotaxis protein